MNKLKAILIDLSGTLHIEDEIVPGAVEALSRYELIQTDEILYRNNFWFRLRASNKFKIRFVTNTTKESKSSLSSLLTKSGFEISTNEIFTSLVAARGLVERERLRPFLLLDDSALEDFEGF